MTSMGKDNCAKFNVCPASSNSNIKAIFTKVNIETFFYTQAGFSLNLLSHLASDVQLWLHLI